MGWRAVERVTGIEPGMASLEGLVSKRLLLLVTALFSLQCAFGVPLPTAGYARPELDMYTGPRRL